MLTPTRSRTRSRTRLDKHIRTAWALTALLAAGCTQANREPTLASRPDPPPRETHSPARPVPPAAQPLPRSLILGHSVAGTPLVLQIFGDGPDSIFIFGGIHGQEPTSAALAARLADYLWDHPEEWVGREIAVLAAANPDGLARGTRVNAHGVDLNRNFPARNWSTGRRTLGAKQGSAPESEPETRAIIRAVRFMRPARIISIHSIDRGRHCNNHDGPAESLARLMARHNGYPASASMGYPTPGSFGSWAGIDRGIPTITLELPRDAGDEVCWRDNKDALLAFIRAGTLPAD